MTLGFSLEEVCTCPETWVGENQKCYASEQPYGLGIYNEICFFLRNTSTVLGKDARHGVSSATAKQGCLQRSMLPTPDE